MPKATLGATAPIVVGNGTKSQIPPIYSCDLNVLRDGEPYLSISTPLPENFQVNITSRYGRPLDAPLSSLAGGGGLAGAAEKIAAVSTGMTSQSKYMSVAIWEGGCVLTFDMPFVFYAFQDAKKEVAEPIKKLMKLAAPSELAGLLVAPGPRVLNASALMSGDISEAASLGGDFITLHIGNFLRLEPCIITNVAPTFSTQFDANGTPISADVNVQIEAYYTITKEDLDKLFAPCLGGS